MTSYINYYKIYYITINFISHAEISICESKLLKLVCSKQVNDDNFIK